MSQDKPKCLFRDKYECGKKREKLVNGDRHDKIIDASKNLADGIASIVENSIQEGTNLMTVETHLLNLNNHIYYDYLFY